MPEDDLMTPQQRVQLNHVVKQLHTKFHGVFNFESVEAFVFESYDEIARRATVTTWLVSLRRRTSCNESKPGGLERPLAKSVPAVLFLCVHNAGRSQMALGWFNHLAAGRAIAWSGGSEPGSELNPDVVKAMTRLGAISRGS